MSSKEKDDQVSLVLSIFKGENFVCKDTGRFRCQIEAKCCGKTVYSGVIVVTSTNSEPLFNSQIAWQLTRKELRELREKKETVKVRCLLLNEDSKASKSSELGYVILYVKDAFPLGNSELDPTKAKSYPLLGTKEQWKSYQPRLRLQLHIEDNVSECIASRPSPAKTQKKISNPVSQPPPPKYNPPTDDEVMVGSLTQVEQGKHTWAIDEDDGCFMLGKPTEGDDLYIMDVTIVSACNLHKLWNGRSPKNQIRDDHYWEIKYLAYGCEIRSDPFRLNIVDEHCRTFIGDKATARIRANSGSFFEYLNSNAMEFHAVRSLHLNGSLVDEEVMGVCQEVDLSELSKYGVDEIKQSLEFTSEWGRPVVYDSTEKPEVKVVFHLETVPGHFCKSKAEIPTTLDVQNKPTDVDDHLPEGSQTEAHNDFSGSGHKTEVVANWEENNNVKNTCNQAESFKLPERSGPVDDKLDNFENERGKITLESNRKVVENVDCGISGNVENDPGTDLCDNSKKPVDKSQKLTDYESSSDPDASLKENLTNAISVPGMYKVVIKLSRVYLKSRNQMKENYVLGYSHPYFGIEDEQTFIAYPGPRHALNPSYQILDIAHGTKRFECFFEKLSDELINEPMTLELRKSRGIHPPKTEGFCMIPVGNILFQPDQGGIRTFSGKAYILQVNTNIKIGSLTFFVSLVPGESVESQISPVKSTRQLKRTLEYAPLSDASDYFNQNSSKGSEDDFNDWKSKQKAHFRQQLKHKEKAYMQLLAKEAAERDKQREQLIMEQMKTLKDQEKYLHEREDYICKREEELKDLENELTTNLQRETRDRTIAVEDAKMSVKRLKEEHKLEISLLQRKLEDAEMQLEKYKGKINVLEKKLEEKDEFINRLKAEKYELPETQIGEKCRLLEHENKCLKKQLRETESKRDQYQKQARVLCLKLGRLQDEKDEKLKIENESLRLQILASREQKELKKERKAVADLSQTVQNMKDKRKDKDIFPGSSGAPGKSPSKEDEITRLTKDRDSLLDTGAYTQYDKVIKEMEKRILVLANEDGKTTLNI